jgi:hypothetical protein
MAKMICERCGTVDKPRKDRRGSFAVELVLWLLFCVPGLIYTIWRLGAAQELSCRSCGGGVMSLDSPRGQRLLSKYHSD